MSLLADAKVAKDYAEQVFCINPASDIRKGINDGAEFDRGQSGIDGGIFQHEQGGSERLVCGAQTFLMAGVNGDRVLPPVVNIEFHK